MKHKIRRKLEEEIQTAAPDLKDQIKASVDWDAIARQNAPVSEQPKRKRRWIPALTAACAVLVIGLTAIFIRGALLPIPAPTEKTVVLSINPSVEFTVNGDTVTAQRALNRDGVTLLLKEDFTGASIEDSLSRCIRLADRYGYFGNTDEIGISVMQDGARSESAEEELILSLRSYIEQMPDGTQLTLSRLTEKKLDELLKSYDERDLTDFEEQELERFKETLLTAVDEKITRLNELIDLLLPYGSDRADGNDKKTPLTDEESESVNRILDDFTQTYRLPFLSSYDRSQLVRKDVDKITEEIEDLSEDLRKTRADLLKNADEDDYKDQLEDLFELVLLYLNGDDKKEK